ncbi:unnamed protein product [marine sediment metagenome]|uniref:Uncharacterized protein n=1 Tax=marine sediment metagenome TaxID=412755 RepID=X1DG26_9ZZZZ
MKVSISKGGIRLLAETELDLKNLREVVVGKTFKAMDWVTRDPNPKYTSSLGDVYLTVVNE